MYNINFNIMLLSVQISKYCQ